MWTRWFQLAECETPTTPSGRPTRTYIQQREVLPKFLIAPSTLQYTFPFGVPVCDWDFRVKISTKIFQFFS